MASRNNGSSAAPESTPTRRGARPKHVLGALMLAVGALLYGFTEWLRINGSAGVLGEGGPVELAQLGLLASSVICLWRAAASPRVRPVAVPFASVLVAAITRELDGPLDRISHGVWKFPA